MNRPMLKAAVLTVTVYIAGLIALFPAPLAARWFVPPVPGLVLGAAEGSIWHGQVNNVEYRGWNAGKLEWSVRPLSLLGLRLSAGVEITRGGGNDISAIATITPAGKIVITNLRGGLAIAELEQAQLVPRNFASGALLVNVDELEIVDGRPVTATGRLGLTGLRSPLLPDVPLGDYSASLQTGINGIAAEFSELEAPISIDGNALLHPDGRYTVSGHITPKRETPEILRRGLSLTGSPDASGRYTFSFEGNL